MILPIKKKWFDMIRTGEKKEEYRDIKPYYDSRFRKAFKNPEPVPVIFRNGYSASSPCVKAYCTLSTGEGKEEWGAEPGKEYYILHIKEWEAI